MGCLCMVFFFLNDLKALWAVCVALFGTTGSYRGLF